MAAAVEYLTAPAPRKWIAGRTLTLLSQYFAPNMDEGVAAAIADDWCAMLADYPAWAIANACRWWMSRENPNKHRRPVPGDIQERCEVEVARTKTAKVVLGWGQIKGNDAPAAPPMTVRDDPEAMERRRALSAELLGKLASKGFSA